MKALIWLFLITAIHSKISIATEFSADINSAVERLDQLIENKKLAMITVSGNEELEGVPPEVKFYILDGRLVAAAVSTGHETWASKVTWYFYDNGKPMKYLRVITGRQSQPEREAIIYNLEGKVLWNNIDHPLVEINDILSAFTAIGNIRQSASRY